MIRVAQLIIHLSGLLLLGYGGYQLAAVFRVDPWEWMLEYTGITASLLLLLTLSISPVKTFVRRPGIIRWRRPLGLWAFAFALCHVAAFYFRDVREMPLNEIVTDVLARPFILLGISGFVLMVPLVVTSTQWAQKRLGRRWKRIHQMVYLVAILVVMHAVSGQKLATWTLFYGVAIGLLLVWRGRKNKKRLTA